jgi:hypothetical protein
MKTTTVGVYQDHEKALDAIKELKKNGIPEKEISIIWSKEKLDDEFEKQTKKITTTTGAEVGATVSIGTVLGVLTGVGVFAVPGFGFLYGAGAIIGAIAGFGEGLIGGGLISALSIPGIKREHHAKYEQHLKEGRYLVMVTGEKEEMQRALEILKAHGQHHELETF